MPSFDVVSRIEMQEVDNAISNSMKEIGQRYDFKGSASKLERTEGGIILLSEDEMKAKQVLDILISNLIKRNVDPKVIKLKSSESASGNTIRQNYDLLEGIDQEVGKKITKLICKNLIPKKILIITSGRGKKQWLEANKYGCQSW